MNQKHEIRHLFSKKRKQLASNVIKDKSSSACTQLQHWLSVRSFNVIAAYIAHHNELSLASLIDSLLAEKKVVLLPKYDNQQNRYIFTQVINVDTQLVPGQYGIMEPQGTLPFDGTIDTVLVPGIAFDRMGNRIGHGKGIYDRLLDRHTGITIGCAYSWQVIDSIPAESHDIRTDYIATEKDIIPTTKK